MVIPWNAVSFKVSGIPGVPYFFEPRPKERGHLGNIERMFASTDHNLRADNAAVLVNQRPYIGNRLALVSQPPTVNLVRVVDYPTDVAARDTAPFNCSCACRPLLRQANRASFPVNIHLLISSSLAVPVHILDLSLGTINEVYFLLSLISR